jgi:hypothetical protein
MTKIDELPKETDKNHVSVGQVGMVEDYSYAFYNPHNARFYFNFMKWNFKPDMTMFKVINSKELMIEFMDCRIVVKKNLIEIINKINKERRFKIDGSLDNIHKATVKAISILELECITVLKELIRAFGGTSDCVCVRSHIPDNKILHDKIVDSIPDEVTFRNDVSKKVYKVSPKNVEISTPAGASKVFRNLALFDFAPEIAEKLNILNNEFNRFESQALNPLTEQIVLHLEVQRETLKTLKAIQDNLRKDKIKSFIDEYR